MTVWKGTRMGCSSPDKGKLVQKPVRNSGRSELMFEECMEMSMRTRIKTHAGKPSAGSNL